MFSNNISKLLAVLGIANIDKVIEHISQAQSIILGCMQIVATGITVYFMIKNKKKNGNN